MMPFDRGIFGGGLYELNRHHSRVIALDIDQ